MEFAALNVRTRVVAAALVALGLVAGLVAYSPGSAAGAPAAQEAAKKGKKGKKKKKKKKKQPAPVAPPVTPVVPAPTPQPLTASEVIQRVSAQAAVYCSQDELCLDSGHYSTDMEGLDPDCESRSTFTWVCYGYNDEDFEPDGNPDGMIDGTCDFREIVSRSGINGVTSQLDMTFGDEGFDCYLN